MQGDKRAGRHWLAVVVVSVFSRSLTEADNFKSREICKVNQIFNEM